MMFPVYRMLFHEMVGIFLVEREYNKCSKIFNKEETYEVIFSERLTRIERWRLLLMWFFINEVHAACQQYKTQTPINVKNVSPKENALNELYATLCDKIIAEYSEFSTDCNSLKNSNRFQPLFKLKQKVLTNFKAPKGSMREVLNEIGFMAGAFHTAYQRCRKKIKALQNLKSTPDECAGLCEAIVDNTKSDCDVIKTCLNIIVEEEDVYFKITSSPPSEVMKELLELNTSDSRLKSDLIYLYNEYTKIKGQVEDQNKKINEMNVQQKKKLKKMNVQIYAMSLDKKLLDEVRKCNIYRQNVKELETTSGNEELNNEMKFPIYNMLFEAMIAIYVVERKMGRGRKTLDTSGKYSVIFRQRLTRIERWRILITWFFFEDVYTACQTYDSNNLLNFEGDTATVEETTLHNLYKALHNNIKEGYNKFRKDCESLDGSKMFEILRKLKVRIIQKFKAPHGDIRSAMDEIAYIAQAVHDSFQQSDKKINIVQNMTSKVAECIELQESVLGFDKKLRDHDIIKLCFNIIVEGTDETVVEQKNS